MAKLILSAYRAQDSGHGRMSVIFDLRNGDPFPGRTVEIKRAADAAAALEAYKTEAASLGQPLAISMRIAPGDRSPAGFKALNAPHYHFVNV